MCRGPSISILCFNLFFEKFLNHQVRINKRVECVDYHPTPPGLVTLNLKDPPSHIYSQYLFQLSVKPVYYIKVGEKSKNMVFRLLENAFVSQKIESKHFYSCKILPQVQSSPPGSGKLLVSPRQHSFKNLFTQQKGVCPTAERVAIWVYNIMFMGFSSFVIVRFFSISTNDW